MPASLDKTVFDTPKLSDQHVFEKLTQIAEAAKMNVTQRNYHSVVGGDPFKEPSDQSLLKVLSHGEMLLKIFVHHHNAGISLSVIRQLDDSFCDRVEVQPQNAQVNVIQMLEFVSICKKVFGEIGRNETIGSFLGKDVQKHYQAREAALVRLEQSNTQTMERLDKYVLELTDRFQGTEQTLQKRYGEKENDLETRIESQHAELNEREKELDERLADVNDRESKFERRRTISELLQKLDSSTEDFKFELTTGTQRMRWPVIAAAALLLAIVGSAAAYLTYYEMTTVSPQSWTWIRPTLFSVGFVVAFGFFARWLSSWAHQHAAEEFRLKRMLLDVRRANLVIETALEWRQETQEEIPQVILDALSRNLFREGETEEVAPVETVATALFGSAAQATLKVGENEIMLDRKSIESLKKREE